MEADFMHTISGSSTVTNFLALPSEYASEDIPNKDYTEKDLVALAAMCFGKGYTSCNWFW